MATTTRTTVKNLRVGDRLHYADGDQTITRIEQNIALDLRTMYDIYVDGTTSPRTQPGSAPITVIR